MLLVDVQRGRCEGAALAKKLAESDGRLTRWEDGDDDENGHVDERFENLGPRR